jgi:hypothetical protein
MMLLIPAKPTKALNLLNSPPLSITNCVCLYNFADNFSDVGEHEVAENKLFPYATVKRLFDFFCQFRCIFYNSSIKEIHKIIIQT